MLLGAHSAVQLTRESGLVMYFMLLAQTPTVNVLNNCFFVTLCQLNKQFGCQREIKTKYSDAYSIETINSIVDSKFSLVLIVIIHNTTHTSILISALPPFHFITLFTIYYKIVNLYPRGGVGERKG